MQLQQLDSLGERLLRGGMAPRHVRRYLRELRDHYQDVVQDELNKGADRAMAEDIAAGRLGDPDRLAQGALARPELLSWSRRWPWAIYLVAPLLLYPAAFVATILAMVGLAHIVVPGMEGPLPASLVEILVPIRHFGLYALPVIAASSFAMLAGRRGVSRGWALASIALVTFFGALPNLDVSTDQIGAGIGFSTRFDFLVEMFLQRWLPTAAVAVMLCAAAGHIARRVRTD